MLCLLQLLCVKERFSNKRMYFLNIRISLHNMIFQHNIFWSTLTPNVFVYAERELNCASFDMKISSNFTGETM